MKCPKCGGLTTPERLTDMQSGIYSGNGIPARRCISCGNIFEIIIAKNKQLSLQGEMPNVQIPNKKLKYL